MAKRRHLFNPAWITGLAVVALGAAVLCVTPLGRAVDRHIYDMVVSLRGDRLPPNDILIIAVDESSMSAMGVPWPFPRRLHADLIETVFQHGARTMVFDIIFSEPSTPEDDAYLAETISTHPGVVLAATMDIIETRTYTHQIRVEPWDAMAETGVATGLDILPVDPDGFVRRFFPHPNGSPSLASAAVTAFIGEDKGHKPIYDGTEALGINFFGPPRHMPTISYYQALDPDHWLTPSTLKDKLVFVGFSLKNAPFPGRGRPDHYPVPISRKDKGYMAGVEIQATIAADLLLDIGIGFASPMVIWPVALGFWALFGVFLALTSPLKSLTGLIIIGVSCLCMCYAMITLYDVYVTPIPMFFPMGAMAGYGFVHAYVAEIREKQFVRRAFEHYVSPKVIAKLMQHPETLRQGGESVDATVLYLDIEGFTTMAETMPTHALTRMLSRYLGEFTRIILAHDGMVDKYVGDAVMAVWGVPFSQENHADMACHAATEILDRLRVMNREHADITVAVRIGVNSGNMVAGNVGTAAFFNYTVHGDAANIAVRLEGVNKIYGTRVLLGQETVDRLSPEWGVRKVDSVLLKGRKSRVTVYELVGAKMHPAS